MLKFLIRHVKIIRSNEKRKIRVFNRWNFDREKLILIKSWYVCWEICDQSIKSSNERKNTSLIEESRMSSDWSLSKLIILLTKLWKKLNFWEAN